MINNTSPFYISLIDTGSTNKGYVVNAGEINSFIFGTYKAEYDEIKPTATKKEKRDYYARVGESPNISKTFEFGEYWTPTFYTVGDCDIYLTIPKIPAGFNFIPSQLEGLRKDWWLKPSVGNVNFLNQFKIVKNTDSGFEAEKVKNLDSINTDDKEWKDGLNGNTQFLKDSEYSGKLYIKLADIKSSNVNHFFRSNVISPTRYIRYGSLGLRNLRLIVDVYGLLSESVNIASDPGVLNNNNWKNFRFFHERKYESFRLPDIFDFTEGNIQAGTLILNDIDTAVKALLSKYYYSYIRGKTESRNTPVFLEEVLVGRVLALYKNKLGDKLQIRKIREDIPGINKLINDSNISISAHAQVLGNISEMSAMTKEDAIDRIFGWDKKVLTKAEELITFIGF